MKTTGKFLKIGLLTLVGGLLGVSSFLFAHTASADDTINSMMRMVPKTPENWEPTNSYSGFALSLPANKPQLKPGNYLKFSYKWVNNVEKKPNLSNFVLRRRLIAPDGKILSEKKATRQVLPGKATPVIYVSQFLDKKMLAQPGAYKVTLDILRAARRGEPEQIVDQNGFVFNSLTINDLFGILPTTSTDQPVSIMKRRDDIPVFDTSTPNPPVPPMPVKFGVSVSDGTVGQTPMVKVRFDAVSGADSYQLYKQYSLIDPFYPIQKIPTAQGFISYATDDFSVGFNSTYQYQVFAYQNGIIIGDSNITSISLGKSCDPNNASSCPVEPPKPCSSSSDNCAPKPYCPNLPAPAQGVTCCQIDPTNTVAMFGKWIIDPNSDANLICKF
jgi:hypothetical protein